MARRGLTLAGVVKASHVHERTIKAILNGSTKPHPRTLHRLAVALDASADEFFQPAPAELQPANGAERDIERQVSALLKTDKAEVLRAVVHALYASHLADQGQHGTPDGLG